MIDDRSLSTPRETRSETARAASHGSIAVRIDPSREFPARSVNHIVDRWGSVAPTGVLSPRHG